jgi:hypothetical protein
VPVADDSVDVHFLCNFQYGTEMSKPIDRLNVAAQNSRIRIEHRTGRSSFPERSTGSSGAFVVKN